MARIKGAKNKPKTFPVNLNVKVTDLDKLENCIAKQDGLIAQLQDSIKDLELQKMILNNRIDNYRSIIVSLMEITS
jgi:hypothetical protein